MKIKEAEGKWIEAAKKENEDTKKKIIKDIRFLS